jgi:hypothetical protein
MGKGSRTAPTLRSSGGDELREVGRTTRANVREVAWGQEARFRHLKVYERPMQIATDGSALFNTPPGLGGTREDGEKARRFPNDRAEGDEMLRHEGGSGGR